MIVHAGLLALYEGGTWRGALIEGPSGSGKSDLALRALDLGFHLVSDDRTLVWACQGRLYGACPAPIAGLIEARGLGVLSHRGARRLAPIDLVVSCEAPGAAIERLPEPRTRTLLGIGAPVLRVHALEASAPAKLRWALSQLGALR
jgi:serine kinase of HPr protein (carbohydrate metabolism regulator)